MRGVGAVEALRALLPDGLVPVFALVTQLGDVWFVFVVLGILYWGDSRLPGLELSRPAAALVIALALGGLSLTTGLKHLFELPRPPMPGDPAGLRYVPTLLHEAYINAATADGYGFPSGHAIMTTVVWSGLAVVLDVGNRRRRAVVAGVVIALVSFSRVALGVHYAVDVVAGVAVGLAYLGVVVGLTRRHTRVAFWSATVVAAGSVVVGGMTFDTASVLGATVGAAVAWELLGNAVPDRLHTWRAGIAAVAIGLPVFGGLAGVVYALTPSFLVTGLTSAAVLVGVLALPLVVEQIEKRFQTG
jgi:membrane-associated phospholipid phosphatase